MKTLTLAILLGTTLSTLANVRLPAVFGHHMILQRDTPQCVWGTADPGEKVTVSIQQHSATATADAEGNWTAKLPALVADGKKHELTVQGNNKLVYRHIIIGDIWIGSGQSNMEWPLHNTANGKEFIAKADHPDIRLFHIPKRQTDTPSSDLVASWKACNPDTIPNFSAVLYHFGKEIQPEIGIPVGLINSSWGGSRIEPWTVTENSSGKMYNGMIAPITKFPVRGVIWYQGESNVIAKHGLQYTNMMSDLITGWRSAFNNKDMPFYFVQIAPWSNKRYEDGQLPALWEAQVAALKIPNTGLAVTTDLVDDLNDIHPRNKHDVGHRLALWALAKHYGKNDLVYSGPLFKSIEIKGNKAHLSFAHAKGLKSSDGKPLNEFTIAGADGNFVPAEATIDNDSVIVTSKEVSNPTQVRFGWHRSAIPNLVNAAGLPASPFQTNNWTGSTGE